MTLMGATLEASWMLEHGGDDFLCASAGGPMYYRGRDMALCHRGMRISESDWNVLLGHAGATLAKFKVPEAEQRDVVAFVQGLKKDIVEGGA
jgi:hemoglobin